MKYIGKYEEVQFRGCSLEDAVNALFEYNESGKYGYVDFNGTTIFSDSVTMDNAYKEVTGMTYVEFQEMLKENERKARLAEKAFQEKLPSLVEKWTEKGEEIFSGDRLELWKKIVPIRLNDLYHGMELGNCVDIVIALNDGCSLDDAKKIIESQDHSGMSFGLVCSMVKEFSDRGTEFVDYVK